MKLLKTVLIMLICAIPLLAQNGDVVISINGHDYILDDFSSKEIYALYKSNFQAFEGPIFVMKVSYSELDLLIIN